MNPYPIWPPPFQFPPHPQQIWTPEEKFYLSKLVLWRLDQIAPSVLSADDIGWLIDKLATPKAVKRFHRVRDYEFTNSNTEITYVDWLDRVLSGYVSFIQILNHRISTAEGEHYQIYQTLQEIVSRSYRKHFNTYLPKDKREDIVAKLFLAIVENYFYDNNLDQWLWRTAQNIIFSSERRPMQSDDNELDDEIYHGLSPGLSGQEWLAHRIQHDEILDAIRRIRHQRYRVVLLLLYLYDLNNTELAAFFGVSVEQVTTWKSRARKSLRATYVST